MVLVALMGSILLPAPQASAAALEPVLGGIRWGEGSDQLIVYVRSRGTIRQPTGYRLFRLRANSSLRFCRMVI
jgi:hypothetical protein